MADQNPRPGISIPGPLVEFILLGPMDDRRQLQDSPILGDVWIEFGRNPAKATDLLISPFRGQHAGSVAAVIDDGLGNDGDDANISYLQGLVVARLDFASLLRVVVPKTKWWIDKWVKEKETAKPKKKAKRKVAEQAADASFVHELKQYDDARVKRVLTTILSAAGDWYSKSGDRRFQELPPLDRFVALAGLILWAGAHDRPADQKQQTNSADQILYVLDRAAAELEDISAQLHRLATKMLADTVRDPLVWQVSLNRSAMPALTRSVPAVKADAAKTLFKVNCSEIAWAVIDSGIDGSHAAFGTVDGKGSRVKRSFDFQSFRRIVSLSNSKGLIRKKNVEVLMDAERSLLKPPDDPDGDLKRLAEDARNRGPIHWELVERFVEIKPDTKPLTNHGTHVAGILGASRSAAVDAAGSGNDGAADGMCPDISLFDFRVLGPQIKDTEFAIIAALQFIRYLNDRDNFFTIHGANLSLSIPHDVRNFACGRTPICNECERLVESGVVVVAAAGNHGYKSFETKDGSYDSYTAFSITDPGNADSVVTVGSTHRFWPHTYGVSFFSSRGPTGDGRIKPDLVAPGERIHAPIPGTGNSSGAWGDLDGTSMAAPHVSGAAAMLMARYSELIGQPRRVKRILCDSATDLGRERTFQGHGMLDVLRAFQSI